MWYDEVTQQTSTKIFQNFLLPFNFHPTHIKVYKLSMYQIVYSMKSFIKIKNISYGSGGQ